LLAAFLTHGSLGFRALYRRRHLRMPLLEAWQLGLGLTIPWLLIPHVSNVRLGYSLYGFDDSYYRIVYQYWLTQPFTGLPRQFILLLAVWIHGCIGIHMAFRFRPRYARWRRPLLAAALLIPTLAVVGIINAGWDSRLHQVLDPEFALRHGPPVPGTPAAAQAAQLATFWQWLQVVYIALVAAILILRWLRNRHARRGGGIAISYSHGPKVSVRRGFSVLEASRWGGVPHASVCGGRGRCSTCRVRILAGLQQLPWPAPAEIATLYRIQAPHGVRLACQLRPTADVTVQTLVSVPRKAKGLGFDLQDGRELIVTALSVDLRNSTRLAANRLPFDVIFIVDRYIQAVSSAIQAHGGHVTSVAGDGIMSVFGFDGNPWASANNALAAAAAAWRSVDEVSRSLSEVIDQPLRFGIGIHTGVAVVGTLGLPGQSSLQFLGDTGNVAARLEAMTKELGCTMIVSAAVIGVAGIDSPNWKQLTVTLRGRDAASDIDVYLIHSLDEAVVVAKQSQA
jgi:adenylate cyclase